MPWTGGEEEREQEEVYLHRRMTRTWYPVDGPERPEYPDCPDGAQVELLDVEAVLEGAGGGPREGGGLLLKAALHTFMQQRYSSAGGGV